MEISFLAAVMTCGVLSVWSITPPNQTPRDKDRVWHNDSLWFARSTTLINFILTSAALVYACHALFVAAASKAAVICPLDGDAGGQRNPDLFRWSSVTAIGFLLIVLGAPLRLGAYSGLGRNFTFGLAKPSGLITDGIYSLVQHPSYTGIVLVVIGNLMTFLRFDGLIACFVTPDWWPLLQRYGPGVQIAVVVITLQRLATRVMQEEAMLKELFGKEWEMWHDKTKRFIPYVF